MENTPCSPLIGKHLRNCQISLENFTNFVIKSLYRYIVVCLLHWFCTIKFLENIGKSDKFIEYIDAGAYHAGVGKGSATPPHVSKNWWVKRRLSDWDKRDLPVTRPAPGFCYNCINMFVFYRSY